jgi:hypothetical protein
LANEIGGYSLDLGFDDALSEFVLINQLHLLYFRTNWSRDRTVTLTNPFQWTLGEGHGLLMNSLKRPVLYDQDGVASYVWAASTVDASADTSLWAPWVAGDLKYLILPQGVAPRITPITNLTMVGGATLHLPVQVQTTDSPSPALAFSLVSGPDGMTIDPVTGVIMWRPAIQSAPSTNVVTVKSWNRALPDLSATQSFVTTVYPPKKPSLSAKLLDNGHLSVTVFGDAGPDYYIQEADTLVAPIPWRTTSTNLSAVPPLIFTPAYPGPPGQAANRFYRVVLQK